MNKHVPCGACNAYVPKSTGCVHWRPAARRTPKGAGLSRHALAARTHADSERLAAMLTPRAPRNERERRKAVREAAEMEA